MNVSVRQVFRPILTAAGAVIVGGSVLLGVAAALLAMAWIFVFGDNEWPKWSDPAIMSLASAVGLVAGVATGWTIWHLMRSRSRPRPLAARP